MGHFVQCFWQDGSWWKSPFKPRGVRKTQWKTLATKRRSWKVGYTFRDFYRFPMFGISDFDMYIYIYTVLYTFVTLSDVLLLPFQSYGNSDWKNMGCPHGGDRLGLLACEDWWFGPPGLDKEPQERFVGFFHASQGIWKTIGFGDLWLWDVGRRARDINIWQ